MRTVNEAIPDVALEVFNFRDELISDIEQYLSLARLLYDKIDLDTKLSTEESLAPPETGFKNITKRVLTDAIKEVWEPNRVYLKCRKRHATDDDPTVIYAVEFCFTRFLWPIDCPQTGPDTCHKERLHIAPVIDELDPEEEDDIDRYPPSCAVQ